MTGINLHTVHQQSKLLLNAYFYGNNISFNPLYVYLLALPYGLFLGGVLAFISQWNSGYAMKSNA